MDHLGQVEVAEPAFAMHAASGRLIRGPPVAAGGLGERLYATASARMSWERRCDVADAA